LLKPSWKKHLRRYFSMKLRPDDLGLISGWVPAIRFLAEGISKRANSANSHIDASVSGRLPTTI